MKALKDYRIGDIILMTSRTRTKTITRIAEVCHINHNGLGLVGFAPTYGRGNKYRHSGQGAFNPAKVGTKPFGLISVARWLP